MLLSMAVVAVMVAVGVVLTWTIVMAAVVAVWMPTATTLVADSMVAVEVDAG